MNYKLSYLTTDNQDKTPLENIKTAGGKILKEQALGQRKLSYKIKKQQAAFYEVIYFELETEEIGKVQKELSSDSNIIRSVLIKEMPPKEVKKDTIKPEEIKDIKKVEEIIQEPEKVAAPEPKKIVEKTVIEKPIKKEIKKVEPKIIKEEILKKQKAEKETAQKDAAERLKELDKKLEEILKI